MHSVGENVGKHTLSMGIVQCFCYETCQCLTRLHIPQCFDSAVSLLGIYHETTPTIL